MTTYTGHFKIRGSTAAQWAFDDPIPLANELCVETDTGKAKLGDGTNHYSGLSYWIDFVPLTGLIDSTTVKWDSATPGQLKTHLVRPDQINFSFDTNSTALTAPQYMIVSTAWAGTITASTLISVDENGAAMSGSVSIEVWKKAGAIPTVADKISGPDPLVLSSSSYTRKTSFTGWSLSFAAGDVFIFKLSSSTACKRVQGALEAIPAST